MSFRFTPGCCCRKPLDCFPPCIPECQLLFEGTERVDDGHDVDFSLVLTDEQYADGDNGDCIRNISVDQTSAHYSFYSTTSFGLAWFECVGYYAVGWNSSHNYNQKIEIDPRHDFARRLATGSYFRRMSYDNLIHAWRHAYSKGWFAYGVVVALPYDYEKEPFCFPGTRTPYITGYIYNVPQSISLTKVDDVRERFKNPEDCGFVIPTEQDTSYVENPGELFSAKDLLQTLLGLVSDDRVPALDEFFVRLYGYSFHKRTWNREKRLWNPSSWGFAIETRSFSFARLKKEEEAEGENTDAPEPTGDGEHADGTDTDDGTPEGRDDYTTELAVCGNQTLSDIEITDENYDPEFNSPGHPDFPSDYLLNCYDDSSSVTSAPEKDFCFCPSREVFGTGDNASDSADSVGTPENIPTKWAIGTTDPLNDNAKRFRGRYWFYAELDVPGEKNSFHSCTTNETAATSTFLKLSLDLAGAHYTGRPSPDTYNTLYRYYRCPATFESTASDFSYDGLTAKRCLSDTLNCSDRNVKAAIEDGTVLEKYGLSLRDLLNVRFIEAPEGKRLEKIVWMIPKPGLYFWNTSDDMPASASDLAPASTNGYSTIHTCGKLRSVKDLEDDNRVTYPNNPRAYPYWWDVFSFTAPYNESGLEYGGDLFDDGYTENWIEIRSQVYEDYNIVMCRKTVNGNGFREYHVDGRYLYLIDMTPDQAKRYLGNSGSFSVMRRHAEWHPGGTHMITRFVNNFDWLDKDQEVEGYIAVSGFQYIAFWKDAE